MGCEWWRSSDGTVVHINRGRSPGRLLKCKFCNYNYREADGKLCDFPVADGKTCDAAMCKSCAVTLGGQMVKVGVGEFSKVDSLDVCPLHRTAVYRGGKLIIED